MTTMRDGIRQSDLADLLGVHPTQLAAVRRDHLHPEEWWKEGRVVFWSVAAVERVSAALSRTQNVAQAEIPQSSAQQVEPAEEVIDVRITSPARNHRFVYGVLDGNRIAVQCAPRTRQRLIGKTIRVRVLRDGGQTTYQAAK